MSLILGHDAGLGAAFG